MDEMQYVQWMGQCVVQDAAVGKDANLAVGLKSAVCTNFLLTHPVPFLPLCKERGWKHRDATMDTMCSGCECRQCRDGQ